MTTNNIYIRTIDGVYSVPAILDKNGNYDLDAYVPKYGFVLKASPYLEDVFNRYVRIYKKHYQVMTRTQFEKLRYAKVAREINQEGAEYYGACWTKNGLKYVGKFVRGHWIIFHDNQ